MLAYYARQLGRLRGVLCQNCRQSSSTPAALPAAADSADLGEVLRLVEQEQTSVSLERLVDFGTSRDEHTLLTAAKWLHRELPVRLAHRIYDLDRLPYGLSAMPSVRVVRDWYLRSLLDIRRFPSPSSASQELQFTELLRGIYERHAHTLITMAKGVVEFKKQLQKDAVGGKVDLTEYRNVHRFLDGFYMSRVGIRVLIGQHLALHEEPRDDWVGLVCLKTSPAAVAKAAMCVWGGGVPCVGTVPPHHHHQPATPPRPQPRRTLHVRPAVRRVPRRHAPRLHERNVPVHALPPAPHPVRDH